MYNNSHCCVENIEFDGDVVDDDDDNDFRFQIVVIFYFETT